MTTFHAIGEENERTVKIKNYKLVKQLNNDTDSQKLTWRNTHSDKIVNVFVTHYGLTPKKKLMFTLRCSETSKFKDDNVLRVILKIEGDRGNSQTTVLRTLHLMDYPLLNVLMRKLMKLYMGKDFKAYNGEVDNLKTVNDVKSVAVEVNSVEEYRRHILIAIKDIMKKLPGMAKEWESKYMDVFVAYDDAKKSTSYEELDKLLQKAVNCAERGNPIGDPWWARR